MTVKNTVRLRHLRHRRLDGLERDRLDHTKDTLEVHGNAAGKEDTTFTIANLTEIATATAHGFSNGDGPFTVTNSGGALPTGLEAGVLYFVGVIDANTFYFYTDKGLAVAGGATGRVTVSDDGTGTHTIHRLK